MIKDDSVNVPSILSKTIRQAADVTAGTSIRYIGQEKWSRQSKINHARIENIELIQDISADETSDRTYKLAWVEEVNKVEYKEAVERAAEEVMGEATANSVI